MRAQVLRRVRFRTVLGTNGDIDFKRQRRSKGGRQKGNVDQDSGFDRAYGPGFSASRLRMNPIWSCSQNSLLFRVILLFL